MSRGSLTRAIRVPIRGLALLASLSVPLALVGLRGHGQEALPKDSLLVFSLTTPMVVKPLGGNHTISSVSANGVGAMGAAQ